MKLNKLIFSFLFLSIPVVAQKTASTGVVSNSIAQTLYLDSIKKTFVRHNLASQVDSLWLKKWVDLDLYNDFSKEIPTINTNEKVAYELSTEVLKARLREMDKKSPFHIEYNEVLENVIKSFLKNRKRSFERLMGISEYYFPLFEAALAKKNIPLEIKYLAIIESALNPKAVSKSGATGLWQFMYETGKQYGLKIDSYIDERSDPLKSSEAAAQYMANLYAVFGDWNLVLASYNSGPSTVTKAIRRSGGEQNYWSIRKNLSQETQAYVPAFLATMYIYEYHKEHKIKPEKAVIKHFVTDTILVKRQLSFKQISDLLDISEVQLQILNPSYKLNIIPSYENQNHYLRLPKDKVAIFTSNEAKIYAYVDREAQLKEKYFEVTPLVSRDSVNLGKTKQHVKLEESKIKVPPLVENNSKTTGSYVVQKGDNLGTIAKKFNVTTAEIQEWNHLPNHTISLGASLQVVKKVTNQEIEISEKTNVNYIVQKGDNLHTIAKKFSISLDELKQWNNLTTNTIALGSTLIIVKKEIPVISTKPTIASFKKKEPYSISAAEFNKEYYVKKGDSLYSISKKYPGVTVSDLKKWNNIKEEELKPGMKLKING